MESKMLFQYKNGDVVNNDLVFIMEVGRMKDRSKRARFRCPHCNSEFDTSVRNVRSGVTKSCGCKKYEFSSIKKRVHQPPTYSSSGVKLMPMMRDEDAKRFWSKVAFTANKEKCWNWTGANNKRYGTLTIGKGFTYKANRIAYYLHYNVDPVEMGVLHKCNNSLCCNPNHIYLGTHDENMNDLAESGRSRNQYTKHL